MKLRRSPETIARIAARPVDAAHAVGALIITASADLKVLYELQYFAGGCRNNSRAIEAAVRSRSHRNCDLPAV